jgi:hypothetical protein
MTQQQPRLHDEVHWLDGLVVLGGALSSMTLCARRFTARPALGSSPQDMRAGVLT